MQLYQLLEFLIILKLLALFFLDVCYEKCLFSFLNVLLGCTLLISIHDPVLLPNSPGIIPIKIGFNL